MELEMMNEPVDPFLYFRGYQKSPYMGKLL